MTIETKERGGGITFECRVLPRAGRNAVRGERGGVLQVALSAPPVDGRANEELVSFLSDILSISKSRISILRGERSRTKLVLILGLTRENLIDRISGN
ncbi:MAG TPA: DUF167 domain-containing protein [bacterium]|nr:DUF167 domain-containing protein [bacterium]